MAHMKLPSAHTTKLSDRSKPVVHIRKEPGAKGYRLFDPINGAIHVSRDLVFTENRGWAWENQQQIKSTGTRDSFTVLRNHSAIQSRIHEEGDTKASMTHDSHKNTTADMGNTIFKNWEEQPI